MNCRILVFLLLFGGVCVAAQQPKGVSSDIDKAKKQIHDIRQFLKEAKTNKDPDPKSLQWNRYTTSNFEILSLDDAQGKYLTDNIEFMRIWVLWRWGLRDTEFITKCKISCVPSGVFFEKLFGRKTPTWRADRDGYNIWIITEDNKWHTRLPTLLTEIVLDNFEKKYNAKLPLWCHRGMSVLNGKIEDIKNHLALVKTFSSSKVVSTTQDAYNKMSEAEKASFDAQAAFFCLWARQEFSGKKFLDYLGGSMTNPEHSLQYFGVKTYPECDAKVNVYLSKLSQGFDHYFTW